LVAGTVIGKVTSSGKWTSSPATGATGEQVGRGVLLSRVDATSADAAGVAITREAEVNGNLLTYDSTVDDGTKEATKNAELAANSGIIVR
jgi:hypothetical protein